MGVTSIQSNPHQMHLIAVGSYDESVCIWDVRHTRTPLIGPMLTGGGVWRVKWHPLEDHIVGAACMGAGFQVIDLQKGDLSKMPLIVDTFCKPCLSLAYGFDWCWKKQEYPALSVVCSFYDHRCALWRTNVCC